MLKKLWYVLLGITALVGLLYLILGQEYITYLNEDIRNKVDDIIDFLETQEMMMVKGGN